MYTRDVFAFKTFLEVCTCTGTRRVFSQSRGVSRGNKKRMKRNDRWEPIFSFAWRCKLMLKTRHRFCITKPFGAPKIHISSSKVNLHFEFGPQTLATRSTHQFSMPTKFQHHPTYLTYFLMDFYHCIWMLSGADVTQTTKRFLKKVLFQIAPIEV